MENNKKHLLWYPKIKFWLISQVKKFQGGGRTDLKFQLNIILLVKMIVIIPPHV